MPRLGERDLRNVLEFVAGLYAVRSLDAFARYGNVALARLVPYDVNAYNEINPGTRRARYVLEPAEADVADGEAALARHVHEHPVVAYYRRTKSRPVLKLSDFLSRRQLHDLGLYTDFLARMRIEHMIVAALPLRAPLQAGFSLCRSGRDFTERDRQVLDLLRPHLAQAYRNVEAAERAAATARWLEEGLERSARGLVVLGPDGRVRAITDRARRWLTEYWGPPARQGRGLPAVVRDWMRQHDAGVARLAAPRGPLSVERGGKRLVVRRVSEGATALLLLEEQRIEPDVTAQGARGLSRREAEVLAWVARGKTNPQIGLILTLSARTVGKHLERVYAKLGVETRTAAAQVALSV